ncbi:uncharacterized protein LOC111631119 isoform X3 [Centruroides sculpturatus]|uniref:uncharacterized protein LOC111631119 isoform X3 n=1 Tax=Centruroides sculpturatus TaxID=218467 RepID=UPI000C6E5C0C|nr:uncharacterized protein LOC111631119 isoform X3 [Centruroides sculpturatus]
MKKMRMKPPKTLLIMKVLKQLVLKAFLNLVQKEKKKQMEINEINKLQQLKLEKEKNEEAYKNWKRKISLKPKSQNYIGYGYVGGILIMF